MENFSSFFAFLQKCIIPKLEKDRPDIAKFFKKAEPFDCTKKNGHDWLVLDDDGKIQATDYLKRCMFFPYICLFKFGSSKLCLKINDNSITK